MGWNDRIENNPYEPYPDYTEQDHYEAWQHYKELCRQEGLSSQNIDPANTPQSLPPFLSRIIYRLLGQPSAQEQQEEKDNNHQQEKEVPF